MKTFVGLMCLATVMLLTLGASAQNIHTVGVNQEFSSIDPAIGSGWTETAAFVSLYDALVQPEAMGGMVPHLAKNWTISEDGKEYTFQIRQGVKFHDGSELTAEDVAFSLVRMLRINQGYSWLWASVLDPDTCCEVLGAYEVKISLENAFTPFLSTLAYFFVVNEDLLMANLQPGDYGEYSDYGQAFLNNSDAGSGAYKLKEWRRGEVIIWERYEGYFKGWPRPNPN